MCSLSTILTSTTASREDYTRTIGIEYHKLIDGKSAEEKAANLKEIQDWAATRDLFNEDLSLTSVTARVKSIRDKFTNLV